MTSSIVTKKRKSEKESDRAILASVKKEMARPRFPESAREEEEQANHRVAHRGPESSEPRGRGLKMKSGKPGIFLRRTFVCSIAVLTIGFLGLGVRAFASADITESIFVAALVISALILVLYFMLRRSTREPPAHSLSRGPIFVKGSPFARLSAWRSSGGRWILSAGPILSRVWHKIGHTLLPRKNQMRLRERMSAEERVAQVSKPPVSRNAA
jgi:hypothetical protein